ncbi:hypothetical protein [Burkholderia cenocepacia]|uniref:hypothetical protein n=1 Tax=Burkholderia cenocepacia TaxID=95486 RepID=UPI00264F20F2|nr:hypothetical protein [Burkholderia cenocepacia]MDN7537026.1 hypothetical protein [Burkholderia cenocepacia]
MPSSPGYKRDYAQEKRTSDARGEKPKRAARNRARREMLNLGMVKKGDGKDVDHKQELSKGGTNARSNLRVRSAHANRSFPRKPDGSVK